MRTHLSMAVFVAILAGVITGGSRAQDLPPPIEPPLIEEPAPVLPPPEPERPEEAAAKINEEDIAAVQQMLQRLQREDPDYAELLQSRTDIEKELGGLVDKQDKEKNPGTKAKRDQLIQHLREQLGEVDRDLRRSRMTYFERVLGHIEAAERRSEDPRVRPLDVQQNPFEEPRPIRAIPPRGRPRPR